MSIYNPAQYRSIKKKDVFEGVLDFTMKNPDGTLVCFFTSTDHKNKIFTVVHPSKVHGHIVKTRKYMVTNSFVQALN